MVEFTIHFPFPHPLKGLWEIWESGKWRGFGKAVAPTNLEKPHDNNNLTSARTFPSNGISPPRREAHDR